MYHLSRYSLTGLCYRTLLLNKATARDFTFLMGVGFSLSKLKLNLKNCSVFLLLFVELCSTGVIQSLLKLLQENDGQSYVIVEKQWLSFFTDLFHFPMLKFVSITVKFVLFAKRHVEKVNFHW